MMTWTMTKTMHLNHIARLPLSPLEPPTPTLVRLAQEHVTHRQEVLGTSYEVLSGFCTRHLLG